MQVNDQNLIWIDLEMTGLNVDEDKIIEIATIVTDTELNIIAEGPVHAIYQPENILAAMDSWNTRQHNESGLVARVKSSSISEAEAEADTLAFLKKHVPTGKSPMCGNTICQDRRFLYRFMPKLEQYFHYRHIDVSTIKELANRWYGQNSVAFKKESNHRALEDIKDSIAELQFYRKQFFKSKNEVKEVAGDS